MSGPIRIADTAAPRTTAPRTGGRGFTGPDAPVLPDLQQCIRCGFCLPHCPTYLDTGEELESPRGRLHLIRGVIDGRIEANDRVRDHLDRCLQCRACETACPSAVPYGRVIEDARAALLHGDGPRTSGAGRGWWLRARAVRWLVRPRSRRVIFAAGRIAQRSGILALAGRVGPRPWRARVAAIPRLAARPFRPTALGPGGLLARGARTAPASISPASTAPASPPPAQRVAMLLGCVHGEIDPETHRATVRVLAALGYEVVAPPDQGCCGALSAHAGDTPFARYLARQNIAAFTRAGIDQVIVNAAGCSAAMREYGRLLRDDRQWAEPARAFALTVHDITTFIASHDLSMLDLGTAAEAPQRVAIQDACHLAHAQGERDAPRTILDALPGIERVELATPDGCCGAAGSYALAQPERSQRILDARIEEIDAAGAQVVATANVGCTAQLQRGLAAHPAEALHVVRLLDQALRDRERLDRGRLDRAGHQAAPGPRHLDA